MTTHRIRQLLALIRRLEQLAVSTRDARRAEQALRISTRAMLRLPLSA